MENMDMRDKRNEKEKEGRRAGRQMLSNVLFALSALLFLGGVYLLLREYVIPPQTDYVAPPPPTVQPATPAPTPAASLPPEQTPAPTPEVTPYNLQPVEILFPTFGKEGQACPIEPVGKIDLETGEEVGLEEPGAMGVIDSEKISAWYKYGPSPGDYGNALINGHRRWKGKKGVFDSLKDMEAGDQVIIRMDDGSYLYWGVESVTVYDREEVPQSVMDPHWGEDPMVTLITCTGSWDTAAGTSRDRVVVTLRPYDMRLLAEEAEEAGES